MHNRLASSNITPHRPHDRTSTTARRKCSRFLTGSPGLPVNGFLGGETAHPPHPEHTHASQSHSHSKPQKIGGTEQMEGALLRQRSSRGNGSKVVCLKYSPLAGRMFVVLCDLPPSPEACGA